MAGTEGTIGQCISISLSKGRQGSYLCLLVWRRGVVVCSLAIWGGKICYLNSNMLQYFSQSKAAETARYTPEDFLFRWKKLERIVERQSLDGLLLVAGLDGGEHPCTSFLFNWLFLGLSGQQVFNNRFLDPKFSELIVLLSPRDSFIFLPPQANSELESLVYALQNCTVFAPTQKEFASRDQFQILKIAAFYRAVSKANKIGFFLEAQQQSKSVEKWPIIQSYALQPVGRTFFTLRFATSNLNAKITPLFRNFDKHSLRELYDRNAYALEGQIRGSLQCIQYTTLEKRNAITESQLQEPLFEAADITGQGTTQRPVRVLLGKNTANGQALSSQEATVQSSSAFHLVVEHFDPATQLQVWRTYFLQANLRDSWEVKLVEQQAEDSFLVTKKHIISRNPNTQFQARGVILNSYLALVQAVLDGVATVSRDYRNLTKEFLQGHIASKLSSAGLPIPIAKEQVEVFLESFDSFGEPRAIDFKDSITFKLTSTFYVLKCRLNGIVDPHSQSPLGSVAFSESFLLQEGCYLLLTKDTPYFDFWRTAPQDYSLLEKFNPNVPFQELGKVVSTDFRGRLFIPLQKLSSSHINLPIINVKFYFHEKGLRLYHQKLGWLLVLYSAVKQAVMVNKISGQWVLFQTAQSLLFDGLEGGCLALEFRGKAFEELMKKVNDKNDPLPLTFLDVVPPQLGENWYFTQEVMKKEVREGALLHQHQILQREFLWAFIQAKQLMVLNQMKDIKLAAFRALYQARLDRKPEELPPSERPAITVINGTYASGKLKLAQTLSKFGPNKLKYHIFSIPAQNLYSKMELSTFLDMLKQFTQDLPPNPDNLTIVVIPSWINSAEALPHLAEQYHLRSVVSKINAGNFFCSTHRELTENALTFAVPGWAQTVVLDSQGEPEALLGSITKILRSFARDSRITRASNSVLSTGQCADILQDRSFNSEYQKFLRNKYGALYKFDQLSQLTLHFLPFRLPLLDLPALKGLSKEEGFLVDRVALAQELQPLRVQAENSKDELMEGLFKLQEVMSAQRKREKTPQVRSLKGIAQLQNDQRAELLWANGIFKERVVPASPAQTLGFCVFARNYDEFQLKQFLLKLTYRTFILQGIRPLIAESSISEQQRVAISRGGKQKHLSDGQFYDGYFYRDVQGHILQEHPKLSLLITQWLAQQNALIESSNSKLREQWQAYRRQFQQ